MSEKLKELLSSLDEKVFTEEMTTTLTESFESAVAEKAEVKAIEIASEKIEEKIEELNEKADEFKAILVQEAEEKEAELLDQVDTYLEKVVEDFIAESKEALDESIKNEKSEMIIEAMDAMLVATGTDIAKIVEAKETSDVENKLDESKAKYDELIETNIALEKENAKLIQMGLIAEMKEGMKVIDAEKFDKLASIVDFENSTDYVNKLETIKESISSNETNITEQDKTEEDKNPSADLNEKAEEKVRLTNAFNHLI